MNDRKIIYVDMDDVLCKFTESYNRIKEISPDTEWPQSRQHFFLDLEPMEGAVNAVNKLRNHPMYDVYILTAPSYMNPHCYTEKRLWIEKHFNLEFCKNLIICNNKGLCKGDYLIDDHLEGRGQEDFQGTLIHFGNTETHNWDWILHYLSI